MWPQGSKGSMTPSFAVLEVRSSGSKHLTTPTQAGEQHETPSDERPVEADKSTG